MNHRPPINIADNLTKLLCKPDKIQNKLLLDLTPDVYSLYGIHRCVKCHCYIDPLMNQCLVSHIMSMVYRNAPSTAFYKTTIYSEFNNDPHSYCCFLCHRNNTENSDKYYIKRFIIDYRFYYANERKRVTKTDTVSLSVATPTNSSAIASLPHTFSPVTNQMHKLLMHMHRTYLPQIYSLTLNDRPYSYYNSTTYWESFDPESENNKRFNICITDPSGKVNHFIMA